jgi:hypothetical protein
VFPAYVDDDDHDDDHDDDTAPFGIGERKE